MAISTETVTISPEQAVKWLAGNTHNREIRDRRVKQYAKDMAEGRWLLSHQGIAFDENGVLNDGQHRLWAIVESNTPTEMLVSWGVPLSSQMIIDDHLQRSIVDAIGLSTDKQVSFASAALATLLIHGFQGGRPSHVQVADGLEKFAPAIAFCDRVFRPRIRTVTQSAVQAVIARAYYSVEPGLLEMYVQSLITGVKPDKLTQAQHNAATLLRNNLLFSNHPRRSRTRRREIYLRTERSLYAFLNGQTLAKLYPARKELFPLPGCFDDAIEREAKRIESGKRRPKTGRLYPAKEDGAFVEGSLL
mgnify:FL=1